MYNISTMSDKSDRHLYHKYETLNISKMSGGQSPPLSRATSPLNHDYDSGIKVWHLVRHDSDSQKDSERSNKLVSEIYLTRYFSPSPGSFHLHQVPFTFIRYLNTTSHHSLSGFSQTFPRLTDLVWVDRLRGSECCNELSVANSVRLGVASLHSVAPRSLSVAVD